MRDAVEREWLVVLERIPVRVLVRIVLEDYLRRRVWEYGLQTPVKDVALVHYAPLIGYRSFSCYFASEWNGRQIKAFALATPTSPPSEYPLVQINYSSLKKEKTVESQSNHLFGHAILLRDDLLVQMTTENAVADSKESPYAFQADDVRVPSGYTLLLDADLICANLTVESGAILVANGYRIFANSNFKNNGTISSAPPLARLYLLFDGESSARFYDDFDIDRDHDLLKTILLHDFKPTVADFKKHVDRARDIFPQVPITNEPRRDWTRTDCYWCGNPGPSKTTFLGLKCVSGICLAQDMVRHHCGSCGFRAEYELP